MKTMTLRNISDDVAAQISATAKETRQSLNGVAVLAMRRGLGLEGFPRRKRDLSAVCGGWSRAEAEAFDRAVAVFEETDAELWKS